MSYQDGCSHRTSGEKRNFVFCWQCRWPYDITVHTRVKDTFLILHFYEFLDLLSQQSHVTSHVTSFNLEYTKEEFNYHQSHWRCVYQTISVNSYKHKHKEAQRDVSRRTRRTPWTRMTCRGQEKRGAHGVGWKGAKLNDSEIECHIIQLRLSET